MPKTYEISTDGFTEALSALMTVFRKENPGIARYTGICDDGTTVVIRIETKKPKKKKG